MFACTKYIGFKFTIASSQDAAESSFTKDFSHEKNSWKATQTAEVCRSYEGHPGPCSEPRSCMASA